MQIHAPRHALGINKVCEQNGDGVSKNIKSCRMCSIGLKRVLTKYEKYMTLPIYFDVDVMLELMTRP